MRQYVEIKSRYRDCILFFRMGDFYEMFFEDALRASRLLDIALTSRDKEANIPMCGVPHHARNARYLTKLIRQGAGGHLRADREPGRRGSSAGGAEVVTRDWSRRGVLDGPGEQLPGRRPVVARSPRRARRHHRRFFHEACDNRGGACGRPVPDRAREFVALEGEGNPAPRGKRSSRGKLLTLLSPSAVAAFPVPPGIGGIPAANHPSAGVVRAALYYLFLHQPAALSEIVRVTEREGRRYLAMDETAVRTLEIFSTMSGERKGSLLWAVDRTRTPMGARLLRAWLAAPLLDAERIGERHDAVGELLEAHGIRKALSPPLDAMGDLSRLASRLAQDRSGPRTWGRCATTSRRFGDQAALGDRREASPSVRSFSGTNDAVVARISSALADPRRGYKEGGVFRPGYDAQVDEQTHLLTPAGDAGGDGGAGSGSAPGSAD